MAFALYDTAPTHLLIPLSEAVREVELLSTPADVAVR
tara:strand:+ start:2001 stop:2111 length:111 start_codon:yes stop_codon:yes gene_type:complete